VIDLYMVESAVTFLVRLVDGPAFFDEQGLGKHRCPTSLVAIRLCGMTNTFNLFASRYKGQRLQLTSKELELFRQLKKQQGALRYALSPIRLPKQKLLEGL
jgi:hypothetical protein